MKKAYVKPEVKEIKMAANQAIAACAETCWVNNDNQTLNANKSELEAQGYKIGLNGGNTTGSITEKVVWPVYQYDGSKDHDTWIETFSGAWHDKNYNGVYDKGDSVSNQSGNIPDGLALGKYGVAVS